ncbi:unnamed protein product [Arabidopsis lyrata]|nr:unnamed protein product [Arabidopsis lyrata]
MVVLDSQLSSILSDVSSASDSDPIPVLFDRLNTLNSQFHEEKLRNKSIKRTMEQILLRLPPIEPDRESHEASRTAQSFSQDCRHHVPLDFSEPRLREVDVGSCESLLKSAEMPVFDGANIYGWISLAERYFRIGGFSDLEKLDWVSVHLAGDALGWFNCEMNRLPFANWFHFKDRLLLRFGTLRIKGPSQSLFCIKQEGTVAAYVQKFKDLSAKVTSLDDQKLQGIFLNGLQLEMQELVYMMKPQSLPEMVDVALSMESHTLRKETSNVADTTLISPREIVSVAEKKQNSELREVISVLDHQEFVVKDDLSDEKKSLQREESVFVKKMCQHRELLCETSSITTLAETASVPKHTLILLDDSKKGQVHRVESQNKSPVVEAINEQFVANGEVVPISPNGTDIWQPFCAHQMFTHRLSRQPSKRKLRKSFKSWRFKFKSGVEAREKVSIDRLSRLRQHLLQKQIILNAIESMYEVFRFQKTSLFEWGEYL